LFIPFFPPKTGFSGQFSTNPLHAKNPGAYVYPGINRKRRTTPTPKAAEEARRMPETNKTPAASPDAQDQEDPQATGHEANGLRVVTAFSPPLPIGGNVTPRHKGGGNWLGI
jgi:hypothetical protein